MTRPEPSPTNGAVLPIAKEDPVAVPHPSFDGMPGEPQDIHRWLLLEGRLDLLRERLVLSDIVAGTVDLEPAEHGEMRGPCPAPDHDDNQKAFFVSDRQGFFHCFACGIHGDAIRWMTDYRGMGYVEAVRHLAAEAGLTPTS